MEGRRLQGFYNLYCKAIADFAKDSAIRPGCWLGEHCQSRGHLVTPAFGNPARLVLKLRWIYLRACGVIQKNLSNDTLSVNLVVIETGSSRPTVYRAFALHDQTVARVIRLMRLKLACELLSTPPFTVPIETLAYRCGFAELRTFNRVFQREFGITAGEFRAQTLQKQLQGGAKEIRTSSLGRSVSDIPDLLQRYLRQELSQSSCYE